MNRQIILFFALALGISSGCFRTNDDCFDEFRLVLEADVTPVSDTLSVGDTLEITISIPVEPENALTAQTVDLSDYTFPVQLILEEITEDANASIYEVVPATEAFNLLLTTGGEEQITGIPQFESSRQGDNLVVEGKVIPQRAGLFTIRFFPSVLFDEQSTLGNPECRDLVEWIFDGPHPDNEALVEDLNFSPTEGDYLSFFQTAPIRAFYVKE